MNKGIAYEIPKTMQRAFEQDLFVFSGMKAYTALREVGSLSFLDSTRTPKSWHQIKQDADKLNIMYNETYLQTEYNFVNHSALQASRWASYEADGDEYYLQYRTANDDRVRQDHHDLAGITLLPSDVFWKEYTPPNGWNCRCVIVQVLKEDYKPSNSEKAIELGKQATTKIDKNGNNTAEIFRFNPGKEQKLIPPKHPYLSGDCGKLAATLKTLNLSLLSLADKRKVANAVDKCKARKEVERLEIKSKYVVTEVGKGTLAIHEDLNNKANDYKNVKESAEFFAKQGNDVQMNPKFDGIFKNPDYEKIYGGLKGTKYWGKCPDIKVGDLFYEHEGFETKNAKKAFKNMLNRGLKQSDKVVIEDCGLTDKYMLRNIGTRIFIEKQDIAEVWVKKGNELRLLYKNAKTP